MKTLALTTGLQTLTAAGAVADPLDISAIARPATLTLTVAKLTSATTTTPRARVVIEDSIDAFAHSLPVAMINIEGPINTPNTFTWNADHIPSCRIGNTGAVLRVNVVALEGSTPSITLEAEMQNG